MDIKVIGNKPKTNEKSALEYYQMNQEYMPLRRSKSFFRRFLDDSGIVDELTKILYKLYDEKDKPPYFIHYFRKYIGKTDYNMPNIYRLRQELNKARTRLEDLQKENEDLRKQLCRHENYWELKPFDYRY